MRAVRGTVDATATTTRQTQACSRQAGRQHHRPQQLEQQEVRHVVHTPGVMKPYLVRPRALARVVEGDAGVLL